MKKVSVVVSIYNAQEYLREMLESLAFQSYPQNFLEIVLVNDGSTDNTENICKEYCEKYSNFILINKQNGGISSARNAGLKVSTGEYITFVDSDDLCDKDYILLLVQGLEESGADLCCCGIIEKTVNGLTEYCYKEEKVFSINDSDAYVDFFNAYWLPVTWNKLYKRSLIKENFIEGLNYDEDTVFNLAYLKNVKKIVCLKECLYSYYIREKITSLTAKAKKNIFIESRKTNSYRINLSKELFNDKRCIYVACRKLVKAVFQEAETNYKNNMPKEEILKIISERFLDEEVIASLSNFAEVFDYDNIVKEIFENKEAEKLLDCAVNGFSKYINKKR